MTTMMLVIHIVKLFKQYSKLENMNIKKKQKLVKFMKLIKTQNRKLFHGLFKLYCSKIKNEVLVTLLITL